MRVAWSPRGGQRHVRHCRRSHRKPGRGRAESHPRRLLAPGGAKCPSPAAGIRVGSALCAMTVAIPVDVGLNEETSRAAHGSGPEPGHF